MFTALLIAILIVGGVAGGIVGGIALQNRKAKALAAGSGGSVKALPEGSGDRLLVRTVADLRVGDVVSHEDRDWIVEGVLQYDEDGHRWSAGRLVDVEDERWLVVGMDRSGQAGAHWLNIDPDTDIGGYPPEMILAGEKQFSFDKRGNATVKILGEGGTLPKPGPGEGGVTRCRWWRYQAPGSHMLLVEDWGGDFRALRGETLRPSDLGFMPGS